MTRGPENGFPCRRMTMQHMTIGVPISERESRDMETAIAQGINGGSATGCVMTVNSVVQVMLFPWILLKERMIWD